MKTFKRLVSFLLVFSMVASMFLTVSAVENGTKAAERTGVTIDRVTTQNTFGESVTHAEGYYWTDKKLEEIPVTYEAWVYMPSSVTYPQEGNVIFSTLPQVYAAGTNNFFSFELKNGCEPKLMFGYYNEEKQDNDVREVVFWSGGRVPKDAWTHLVLVHDQVNMTVSCYLNGELKETKEFDFIPDESNIDNPVALAGDRATANARAFTGILGDVAVYSDVRNATEVRSDYTSGADVNDDDLLCYYQISADKQGKDLEDLSGNGYDMNYNRVFFTEEEMQEIRDKDDKEYAYSIALLPDIQILTKYFPEKLPPVFDYIADSIEDKNIKYLVTLGDLTDTNTQAEWDLVKSQLDRFNGILPYSLLRGNHDGVWKNQPAIYDSIFADPDSEYYKHVQANGGFYDTSSVKNTYLLFEEGNTKYMILSLDYGITDEKILDWADEVISSHPDHRVIIATHAWLGVTSEPFANGEWSSPSTEVAGSIDPGQMWDEHFRKHANIDMIVCGHTHSDQIICTPVVGDNGNVVYQVLIDSQYGDLAVNGTGKGLGGIGVVALMYFTEDGQFAKIEYYSTIFEKYYYEGHTDISLDFDAEEIKYSIAKDTKGNPLNVKVVNGITWVEENGELKMPAGPSNSFLLFDSKLNANRIEATIVIRDNLGWDTNSHRNGLVFALTDHDGDLTFAYNGTDVSYYWAFVTDDDKVEVRKMGKYENWATIGPASATLTSLGIDVTEGVTLAAEWDDEGHIKVYANDQLVQDITDTRGDPLTGEYYGMLVNKYGNSQGPDYAYPYDAPVTSFIAGKVIYDNCIDVDGNPLNVKVVNGVTWVEKNGMVEMPEGVHYSYLLFDSELNANRVEATVLVRDNGVGGGSNHRNGLIFALTDDDGDRTFNSDRSDVSYYWTFINDSGKVEVVKMGNKGNWKWISTSAVSLSGLGIDVTKGVSLAAEWDDQGHIKVYANGILIQDVTDTISEPLTGDLYGMFVEMYGNTQTPNTYDAPVMSFVAGKTPIGDICVDADENALTPRFVNGVEWTVVEGKLKMPKGHSNSFILFDKELNVNRIEATLVINDNTYGDGNHRNGIVFALTDHDSDLTFGYADTDVSYYWAFVNDYGCVEVRKMGKYQGWSVIGSPSADLKTLGIDVTKGVTLAAEWDDEGHIKVYANDQLVQNITDSTDPLNGKYYGLLVNKWGNTQGPDYAYPYNAYATSFVAGGVLETPDIKVNVTVDPTDAGTVSGAGNYYLGATVTLTATPNAGYYFVGWYENDTLLSFASTINFTVTADRDLTAVFTDTAYTVTVNASPADYGTVTGGGTFAEGAGVTVIATANNNYKFVGWYNGETKVSADVAYTFTSEADITLTAKFEKVSYSIAKDANGNLLNPYFVNGVVWVEDENGYIEMPVNTHYSYILFDNPLNANRVEATILVRDNGKGGGGNHRNGLVFALTDDDGDHTFNSDRSDVSFYWAFINDGGAVEVVKMGNKGNWKWISTSATSLGALGIDVTQGVTLAAEWDNEGHIKVYANEILVQDVTDTISEPLTGNLYGMFVEQWGNMVTPNYYDAPVASFIAGKKDYQINATATPTEGGTVAGAGKYVVDTTVTLTATAKEGYKFVGWYVGEELKSADAAYTFTAEADITLTAKFEKLQASVEVTANGEDITYSVEGNVVTVDYQYACKVGYLDGDKYVAITATPNGDGTYSFTVPEGVSGVLIVVNGDVNGDGVVNAGDYGRLNAMLQGKTTLTAEQDFAANTNGDTTVNAGDYGRLNAVLQGKTEFTW